MAGSALTIVTLLGVLSLLVSFYGGVTSQTPSTSDAADYITSEQRLLDTLLRDRQYNKHLRPANGTILVRFGMALLEIIEMDEVREFLDVLIWMRQLWHDFRLTWDPAEFDGITSVRIPSDQVWRPDIVSYIHPKDDWYFTNNVVVYSSGDVLFIPPGETRMRCPIDLTNFPGDEQYCTAKFGSWTYDGYMVKLDFYEGKEHIDFSDYVTSREFDIIEGPGQINVKYYPCCSEPYPDITFNLTIRRKSSAMYFSLLLTPGLLVALLSPLMFILPSGDPHRFNFGGALLVCLAILMLVLSQVVPPHPSPPLLSSYFSGLFVVVSVSMALSAITANLANRSTRLQPMAAILKKFMSCMARPLCVSLEKDYDEMNGRRPSDGATEDKDTTMMVRQMRGDWHIMATILDRIFFVVFLIIAIILSLAILPRIVNFY